MRILKVNWDLYGIGYDCVPSKVDPMRILKVLKEHLVLQRDFHYYETFA